MAQQALGDREGSVVAIDPRTGELLAIWSYPSYDPNLVSTNDQTAAKAARNDAARAAPGQPLLAHRTRSASSPARPSRW